MRTLSSRSPAHWLVIASVGILIGELLDVPGLSVLVLLMTSTMFALVMLMLIFEHHSLSA